MSGLTATVTVNTPSGRSVNVKIEGNGGTSVKEVIESLVSMGEASPESAAAIGGSVVPPNHALQGGESLSIVNQAGRKG